MDAIGLMILIQPAIFCLTLGTALASAGLSWLLFTRRLQRLKLFWTAAIFLISLTVFSAVIYAMYGIPAIYFECISAMSAQ